MSHRAVFLDRDGVMNDVTLHEGKPYAPRSLEQWRVLPGVAEALHQLRGAGFRLIVATNQPDVAAGRQRREVVEAIHARMRQTLPLDDIRVCFHVEADGCACRKPKPGMLLDAAKDWGVDLAASVMVGDRWRDIAAGKAAGCRTILIERGYAERRAEDPDAVVSSLPEAGVLIQSWMAEASHSR